MWHVVLTDAATDHGAVGAARSEARAWQKTSGERPVDALVVGAGPAGAAAAIHLATRGARVALVDRHEFPRDKSCGDALIPDALKALERLGLERAVCGQARTLTKLRVYAPNRRFVVVGGTCASLPRRVFDDLLRREAIARGVDFLPGLRVEAPIIEAGIVRGAFFRTRSDVRIPIRAGVTFLATGANAEPLKRFNVCERLAPSATAARVYVEVEPRVADTFDYLCISYDWTICPGYGWIFPGPRHTFNLGVGYYHDARSAPPVANLRTLLKRFIEDFPPAAELLAHSTNVSALKGAPLRTGLTGARLSLPGLLVIGEAAGLTYSFSGEGIGKAMESGLLAAEIVVAASAGAQPDAVAIAEEYASSVRRSFAVKFRAYRIAQDWLSSPRFANLLASCANRSHFAQTQLAGIFQETADPRELFSPSGLLRLLVS
jgi:geranylgeranyl reductase family protein